MGRFFGGVVVILALAGGLCLAAPKPDIVPGPDEWTLAVRFENPQQIELQLPGKRGPHRFWYIILTLTNMEKRDADFYPKCELMTDTFQIIPAGQSVPASVFDQIKLRHHTLFPFLESLDKVGNRILQGQDNAKDIAIIWPDFAPDAKQVKFFIAGLSNETVAVDLPAAKDTAGKGKKVLLRKTLELTYNISGDPAFRSKEELRFIDQRWIMR